MWAALAPVIGSIVKAIVEALLGKPIKKEEKYEDVGGRDDPFVDSDW